VDQQTSQVISPKDVVFANGNKARLVTPHAGATPYDILKSLGLESPKAVILIIGGAGLLDDKFVPRLEQLFSRGVARAALESGALIIDGGTQSGVMQIVGQAIADREYQTPLLGVAPAGLVTYPGGPDDSGQDTPLDPHHSHFILVNSQEWGGETDTMLAIAAALAQNAPIITILVNGGDIAKQETLRIVRKGWPIVVIQDSGRLADHIAAGWQQKSSFIADPVMAEVVADGDIHLFPLEGTVTGIQLLIKRLVSTQNKNNITLQLAWERFSLYDTNAERQQNNFNRMQFWILGLGVLATLLVVIQATLRPLGAWLSIFWISNGLHYIIVALPITISALIAASNYFNAGNKWVLLRGSAEAIKREIFRYRAQAEIYSKQQAGRVSPEIKLARKVEAISRNLLQTDVNLSALQPHTGNIPPTEILGQGDNGTSFLSADDYITYRLNDQLNFYRNRAVEYAKILRYLQWLIIVVGGLGTLLAAIGQDLWIAVTTAVATAVASYLNYQRLEKILMTYNQSATDLANVKAWWLALMPEEQANQKNIDKLVNHTEQILKNEHAGWVQEMQDALAELRAEQTDDDDNPDRPAPPPDEEN
jgi:hypothetical protein